MKATNRGGISPGVGCRIRRLEIELFEKGGRRRVVLRGKLVGRALGRVRRGGGGGALCEGLVMELEILRLKYFINLELCSVLGLIAAKWM